MYEIKTLPKIIHRTKQEQSENTKYAHGLASENA